MRYANGFSRPGWRRWESCEASVVLQAGGEGEGPCAELNQCAFVRLAGGSAAVAGVVESFLRELDQGEPVLLFDAHTALRRGRRGTVRARAEHKNDCEIARHGRFSVEPRGGCVEARI